MKSFFKPVIAALFLLSATSVFSQPNTLTQKEKKEGWQLLFNGNNFNGWRLINHAYSPEKGWEVADHTISCTGEKGGSIITDETFGNFELTWEWKMTSKGANSGLKYFVAERPGDTSIHGLGIEYQMLDDEDYIERGEMKDNDFHTTGAAYELYTPSPDKKVKPLGKWNKSRIVSKNGKTEHWLNGEKVLEYDRLSDDFKQRVAKSKFKTVDNFGLHTEGHILLQDHDSRIYFRNIKIRKL